MSGSSQGRGGNTQQEQKTYGKFNITDVLLETACRRRRSPQLREHDYHEKGQRKGENGGNQLKTNVKSTGGFTEFSQNVDAVLVEMMSRNAPPLWDKWLVEILKQYDDTDNRKSIYLYRKAIARLKNMLGNREYNHGTRMILRKTLHSYEKRLDDARDIRTSTPASSDDEDSDEHTESQRARTLSKPPVRYEALTERPFSGSALEGRLGQLSAMSMIAEEMYENQTLNEEKEQKVDDTINSVETPKNIKKNQKADRVTPVDDKASYITTRKKIKNPKNPKDKDEAEPGRKHEAQLRETEIEIPKPAAPMSTPYHCHSAAEVRNKDHQNNSPEPLTISCSIIKNQSTLSTTEVGTSSVLCCNGKSLEKSGSSTSQLVANDSLESSAAVPLDGELKSGSISEVSLDEKAFQLHKPKEREQQKSEDEEDMEKHMEWCDWRREELPEKPKGIRTNRPRGDGREEPKDELTNRKNSSRVEGWLKGGTKRISAVQRKLKEKLDELAIKTMKAEIFKSTGSSRRRKNRSEGINEVGWRMGLQNLKNTCYLNATMQGFASCRLLREAIIRAPEKDWKESRLTRRMKVMFLEMINSNRQRPWNPEEMFKEICTWEKCLGYKLKTQQDAGELIRCMIEHLSEENKTAGKLFLAEQASITKFRNCSEETAIEQKFKTLELNIGDNKKDRIDGLGNVEKWEKSIEGLIKRYTSWEKLTKGNEYRCTACGEHQVPDRQTQFVYGPNILVMQLKRFTKREEHGTTLTTKLNTKVHFQEELSLPCQLSSIGVTANYQLKGVIEHRGVNADSGHYAAYAVDGNQWFEWNDELGKPVTWETVEKAEAYILFWEKKYEEEAQTYEEYEWIEEEDEMEGEGEEEKTMSIEVGSGNANTHVNVDAVEAHMVVPIVKKRRLEPYESFICEKIRLEPKVTVKRHKSNAEELKVKQETLETTERASKRRREPQGRQNPESYKAGETPTVGESYESCLQEEIDANPNNKGANEANKLEVISQLIGTAMNEIKELRQTVEQQSLEITSLKLNLSSLKTKVNVHVLSEDEDRFRDEEMYTKNLPRNSTPVGLKATEIIQHTSHVNNPRPHNKRSTPNEQIEENGTWIKNN